MACYVEARSPAHEKRASAMATTHLHEFERAVLGTIRVRRLASPSSRVLCALSGGADSTALVAALSALRAAGHLAEVCACYVDHQLRAGSAADGEFCLALCAGLGVPLERARVTVAAGENVQAAARRVRYAALRAAAARAGCDLIATGHQRGDQAETVLHRLLRGAGARGLSGIPARRGALVRPLIDRSRPEILDYLAERGLEFREDPTNATPKYLRNRIRGSLLPALEALAPGVERRLARSADLLREDDRALERLAARAAPRGASRARAAALEALPAAARRRAVRRLWRAASGSRRDLTALHVEAVLRLLGARTEGRVSLPRRLEARVENGFVEVGRPTPPGRAPGPLRVDGPGAYALPGRGAAVEFLWTSQDPPPWPLELRTRRPGDRFRSERGGSGRKLKKWLIDRKVPRASRGALWVVADRDGRVLCVPELEARAKGASALRVRFYATGPEGPEQGRESEE